jgi:hypothetical protein
MQMSDMIRAPVPQMTCMPGLTPADELRGLLSTRMPGLNSA